MSVSNIVNKILDDAKLKESDILEHANKEVQKIIEVKDAEIASLLQNSEVKAHEEGANKRERLLQNAYLQVRNNKLKAKQESIAKVFEKSLERLNKLSNEDFISFVENIIKNIDIKEHGTIHVCEKRHSLITSELLSKLNSNLSLADVDNSIEDGFVIKVGNVHYNFTFKSVLESLKLELTSEVIKELF